MTNPPTRMTAGATSSGITPIYDRDGIMLYRGDVLDTLAQMPENSVDCIVTSPPYWSLRKYSGEGSVWGGDGGCAHEWTVERREGEGYTGTARWQHSENGRSEEQPTDKRLRDPITRETRPEAWTTNIAEHAFCDCGAWRGQYGLEPTPELYVEHSLIVLRAIRRVLKPTGTVWWNIGDGYASGRSGQNGDKASGSTLGGGRSGGVIQRDTPRLTGLKPKDLIAMPWRVGLAAQADGWWLRSDIIWSKPNPMPESVTDRPTKSHEYVLLLAKNERYYFDADAVREPFTDSTIARITQESVDSQEGGYKQEQYAMDFPGRKRRDRKPAEIIRAMAKSHKGSTFNNGKTAIHQENRASDAPRYDNSNGRNIRSVWNIPTQPSPLPHFAAFPEELAARCIKAGCPPGGVVLDPFAGTGTTLKVARDNGRQAIGIEISAEYCGLAQQRLDYGIKGVQAIERGQEVLL